MTSTTSTASSNISREEDEVLEQLLIVIRHGERLDNVDGMWVHRSPRPYDPPLTERGLRQARGAGRELVNKTCREILKVLNQSTSPTSKPDHAPNPAFAGMHVSNQVVDVFNRSCGIKQQPDVPASDIDCQGINVLSRDSHPLPVYPEKTQDGLKRFEEAFNSIADDHYPKTVLIVTHGYGVCRAIDLARDTTGGYTWADYCGCVVIKRVGKDSHKWTLKSANKQVDMNL